MGYDVVPGWCRPRDSGISDKRSCFSCAVQLNHNTRQSSRQLQVVRLHIVRLHGGRHVVEHCKCFYLKRTPILTFTCQQTLKNTYLSRTIGMTQSLRTNQTTDTFGLTAAYPLEWGAFSPRNTLSGRIYREK